MVPHSALHREYFLLFYPLACFQVNFPPPAARMPLARYFPSNRVSSLSLTLTHTHTQKVKRLITPHDKTRDVDALRLVLLYALRYDKHSNSELQTLKQLLRARPSISSEDMELIQSLVRFASAKKVTESASDLLSTEQVKAFTKKVIKGLKEVENIYTQHTPVLKDILEELCRNKLKAQHYPYLGGPQIIEKPREILVFMIGGATYEESLVVHQLNESLTDTRIILGSSRIHNTESFLKEVRLATSNPAPKTGSGTHQRKDMHLGGMLN